MVMPGIYQKMPDSKSFKQISATAIVLAGGASSRIGRNKAFLKFKDKTFIESITTQLSSLFSDIIIASNDNNSYRFLPYRVVNDIRADEGPLVGIYSSLAASTTHINFITACDIPILNLSFIRYMLSYAEDADAVVPSTGNNLYEPLLAFYNKSCLGVIESALESGIRKIDSIFRSLNVKYVTPENFDWYRNINTEKDYKSLMDNFSE